MIGTYIIGYITLKLSFISTGVLVKGWLFCLHYFPMFGKFSVHAWSYCGGLNEDQSILVHWACQIEFGPQ